MHPDQAGYIAELYAYFRQILVKNLTPAQLQLHDYFSSQDPLHSGEDCFDEFPLIDGLPEMLINTQPTEKPLTDEEIDSLAYIAASVEDDESE